MLIHTNCRHYRGSSPCTPNKLRGKECLDCDEFDPIGDRILIVKLGAPGDVLRTTALLPGIRRKWPNCQITWLTRESARPLLENLPLLDRVLTLEEDGALQMLGEKFDICINLDNDPLASALATQEKSVRNIGYVLDEFGAVTAANPEAARWLEMACFDRVKRENLETYQSHMRRIVGIQPTQIDPIQISIRDSEREAALKHLHGLGINGIRPIAFNTGAGDRWKTKRWPMDWYLELGMLLGDQTSGRILLIGGPLEEEANAMLAMERPDVFISAGAVPLRVFMALIAECGLLVTSDTMALHIGLGLDIPTVALFGPTSAAEIEGTGALLKIVSPKFCASYYAKSCSETPCCMTEITPNLVYANLKESGWLEPEGAYGKRKSGAA